MSFRQIRYGEACVGNGYWVKDGTFMTECKLLDIYFRAPFFKVKLAETEQSVNELYAQENK